MEICFYQRKPEDDEPVVEDNKKAKTTAESEIPTNTTAETPAVGAVNGNGAAEKDVETTTNGVEKVNGTEAMDVNELPEIKVCGTDSDCN